MQSQRAMLWIVFSMSLLFLWDGWQKSEGKPSILGGLTGNPQQTQTQPQTAPGTNPKAPPPKSDNSVPTASPSAPAAGAAALPGNAPAAAAAGRTLVMANEVLKLSVDTAGAQVKRAELLKHKDLEKKDANVVLMDQVAGYHYVAQSGFIGAPTVAGVPDDQQGFPTHRTVFQVLQEPKTEADVTTVKLAAEAGGLRVVRTLSLAKGSYQINVKDELTNIGTQPLKPTQYLQLVRDSNKPSGESQFYSTFTGPVVYSDEKKFQKVDWKDIEKDKVDIQKTSNLGWVAVIQHYFVSAWVPEAKEAREFYTRKVDTNLFSVGLKQALAELAPGTTVTRSNKLYVGPQDQQVLAGVAEGLDLAVDYGWLTPVAKPIYWLLGWLYNLVHNWGWAIVLLTIVIKTIFFPLQAASYKSMARMKAVTPRMQQIRERYGDDRVKMNQAMMELYKTEKINPLGGCLPIVVQIPVFIALYWVLLASVEMRNAPWIGWIHDLAAPDPWYILPLIMAGTMFIQVKLNPTPPDPVQAKVMMFMPIMFSVMFFFFPAGLVLYWLVNNLYSIAQQWVITRKMEGKPIFGKAPA